MNKIDINAFSHHRHGNDLKTFTDIFTKSANSFTTKSRSIDILPLMIDVLIIDYTTKQLSTTPYQATTYLIRVTHSFAGTIDVQMYELL